MTAADLRIFDGFEWFFTVAFTVELLWNMFAHWLQPFFASGWNVFDLLIVTIAWLSLLLGNLPGVSVLRLFRAFRVFRLFRRVESLRSIIEGVVDSIPAVANAFIVLGLLMGIWSIIGVEFFREFAPQEFGTFLEAMFTMWQVMALDGWTDVARPLIYRSSPQNLIAAPVFFVSFTFVAAIVMANVVIAILLDNYLKAIDKQKEEREEAKALQEERAEHAALELRRSEAMEEEQPVQLLTAAAAVDIAPALVSGILCELCRDRLLQRLPRDELLDMAGVLFTSPITRELLLRHAHGKMAEGKVLGGTAAGDLLVTLAAQHMRAQQAAAAGSKRSERGRDGRRGGGSESGGGNRGTGGGDGGNRAPSSPGNRGNRESGRVQTDADAGCADVGGTAEPLRPAGLVRTMTLTLEGYDIGTPPRVPQLPRRREHGGEEEPMQADSFGKPSPGATSPTISSRSPTPPTRALPGQ